jgi:SnoaL-like domain
MTTIEQRLACLEQEVGELRDAQALRTLLSQYAIAVDDKRPDLLRSLFTDDAALRIPAWQVEVTGIEAVMAFYAQYWARFDQRRRYFANDDTRVNGDHATVFMYWHVTQESGESSVLGWGTYHWQFVRVAGAWRIADVLISILAMTTLAAGWAGANKFAEV